MSFTSPSEFRTERWPSNANSRQRKASAATQPMCRLAAPCCYRHDQKLNAKPYAQLIMGGKLLPNDYQLKEWSEQPERPALYSFVRASIAPTCCQHANTVAKGNTWLVDRFDTALLETPPSKRNSTVVLGSHGPPVQCDAYASSLRLCCTIPSVDAF
eukprot:SAG31_NODE_3497_length_4195_cov_5.065430_4_plen_157_part_00